MWYPTAVDTEILVDNDACARWCNGGTIKIKWALVDARQTVMGLIVSLARGFSLWEVPIP